MAFIVTKGTVRHNGKDYKMGEELPTLKKEEAERLVGLEVIEATEKTPRSKDKTPSE
ncbi:hypothetical protein P9G84_23080 [Brevibacillus centrosporus]|uniref:DUF7210 family protein n=1 Tax=Brevibacillus centrosporus TaxID=54910 RepID=UPI00116671C6|nr:hypothetical protein [Brevibacillus centrosporus]MEC2131815.1 hypothetical protein [Brevibacillus centrosporus]GED35078.1 hypothetical protein BCE02nite_62190 [Brevibacillus centrosporus]